MQNHPWIHRGGRSAFVPTVYPEIVPSRAGSLSYMQETWEALARSGVQDLPHMSRLWLRRVVALQSGPVNHMEWKDLDFNGPLR
jgi:hypothetical protein